MEEKDKMTTDLDRRATLIRRKAKPPAGRERVERLGAEVIYAEERERSQVAQELNDSVGQKLADASFEIAASTNEKEADARAARLTRARALLRAAIDEVRNISGSSHLHFTAELGLPRALDTLGSIPPNGLNSAGVTRMSFALRRQNRSSLISFDALSADGLRSCKRHRQLRSVTSPCSSAC